MVDHLTFDVIGRDPDYLELNKKFALDLFKATYISSMVPPILRPYVLRDLCL